MSLSSFLQMLAGVGVLVYGIVIMGESLQIIAGDRLRKLIGSLTSTPFKGLLVGTIVTGILQSSGATTVMVVSFVDVGFMNLVQAIGVILGANIGTTVTGQLIAFKITNVAYLCALIGASICILCKKERHKHMGVGLIGFSLLFIGMEMMQGPMAFLKNSPGLMNAFSSHKLVAFFAGLLITTLVQSSSATVGLTMVVMAQGLISLETSIIIILGENIGSTTTAVLASLGARRSAKQAALSHVIIKIVGTVVIALILPYYASLIRLTSSDVSRQVANAHTIFNIIIALMFFPFVKQYAKLIRKILPDDCYETVVGPIFLNESLIKVSPAAAVDAVRKEMIRVAEIARTMVEDCRKMFIENNAKLIENIYYMERTVNELTRDIVFYATDVGQSGLSPDLSLLLNSCTSGVGDIERIGDHSINLVEMFQYLQENTLRFSPSAMIECKEMFDLVISSLMCVIKALGEENVELARNVLDLEARIDVMEKTLRAKHITRLNAGNCNAGSGVVFIDILSNLERIGDHTYNLAMVVFDIGRVKKT